MVRITPLLILAALALVVSKIVAHRRRDHAGVVQRVTDRMTDLDLPDSVEALVEQAEDTLKEIRKRLRH